MTTTQTCPFPNKVSHTDPLGAQLEADWFNATNPDRGITSRVYVFTCSQEPLHYHVGRRHERATPEALRLLRAKLTGTACPNDCGHSLIVHGADGCEGRVSLLDTDGAEEGRCWCGARA